MSAIFHQMIALQKLWKMVFISSEKLFSLLRHSSFCIFIFPLFSPVSHCFRGWSKKSLIINNVISCPNKNLITQFVWYYEKEIRCGSETLSIDRELINGQSYQKQKGSGTSHQSLFRPQNKYREIPIFIINYLNESLMI